MYGETKALYANAPTERYAVEYNMNHKRRGPALIFNHERFTDSKDYRAGTKKDGKDLKDTFSNLGFEVTEYMDCTLKELLNNINKVVAQDFSDCDCIAVALLTHGANGGYVQAKDQMYLLDLIFQSFTNDKCPTLAGKPKLFFIQACRGKRADPGITLRKQIQTEASGYCESYRLPITADFFIAYSTVPDYVSFRNTKGSFFIQGLCKELNLNAKKQDINEIMTFVNQHVAINCLSNMPDNPEYDNKNQMSCFTSMLTRILIFKEKH